MLHAFKKFLLVTILILAGAGMAPPARARAPSRDSIPSLSLAASAPSLSSLCRSFLRAIRASDSAAVSLSRL